MTPEELLEKLPGQMASAASQGQGGVALVRLDRADHLRDQLGFTGLRELLAGMADRLVDALDESPEICRFDWSTLVVSVPGLPPSGFDETADTIFSLLSGQTFELEQDSVAVTVSQASTRFDHRFTTVDELLLALTRKAGRIASEGGNQHATVQPGVSAAQALASGDHMLGLLMEALQSDTMKVVFQPLLATSAREPMESYQMLPRLQASDGKLITAGEFLPLAREASLLPVLDRWMTLRAVRLLQGPLEGRPVRLLINQSEALLADSSRRSWLADRLSAAPKLAGHIVVELRLEDAMSHMRGARELLDLARELKIGVGLSMVDEHSRWDLLADSLRADFIRMSPQFVARLTRDGGLEKRFMALSKPVRDQGTGLIMPMIEDPQTAARMWRSGVDFMQGNMIQAPEDTIAG